MSSRLGCDPKGPPADAMSRIVCWQRRLNRRNQRAHCGGNAGRRRTRSSCRGHRDMSGSGARHCGCTRGGGHGRRYRCDERHPILGVRSSMISKHRHSSCPSPMYAPRCAMPGDTEVIDCERSATVAGANTTGARDGETVHPGVRRGPVQNLLIVEIGQIPLFPGGVADKDALRAGLDRVVHRRKVTVLKRMGEGRTGRVDMRHATLIGPHAALASSRFVFKKWRSGENPCQIWRARLGSNQQPLPSEGSTLSIELRALHHGGNYAKALQPERPQRQSERPQGYPVSSEPSTGRPARRTAKPSGWPPRFG